MTLCELRICETILGVKIWQSIDQFALSTRAISSLDIDDYDVSGLLFTSHFHKYTRTGKIEQYLDRVNEYIKSIADNQNLDLALSIYEPLLKAYQKIKQFDDLASKIDVKPLFIVPSNLLKDNRLESLESKNYGLNTSTKDIRNYEQIFYEFKKNYGSTIVLEIESATKGHIALAKKFELLTMVINVMHERHFDRAQLLSPDIVCVGSSQL